MKKHKKTKKNRKNKKHRKRKTKKNKKNKKRRRNKDDDSDKSELPYPKPILIVDPVPEPPVVLDKNELPHPKPILIVDPVPEPPVDPVPQTMQKVGTPLYINEPDNSPKNKMSINEPTEHEKSKPQISVKPQIQPLPYDRGIPFSSLIPKTKTSPIDPEIIPTEPAVLPFKPPTCPKLQKSTLNLHPLERYCVTTETQVSQSPSWNCAMNQYLTLIPTEDSNDHHVYIVSAGNHNKVLSRNPKTNLINLDPKKVTPSRDQQWNLTRLINGSYTIQNLSNNKFLSDAIVDNLDSSSGLTMVTPDVDIEPRSFIFSTKPINDNMWSDNRLVCLKFGSSRRRKSVTINSSTHDLEAMVSDCPVNDLFNLKPVKGTTRTYYLVSAKNGEVVTEGKYGDLSMDNNRHLRRQRWIVKPSVKGLSHILNVESRNVIALMTDNSVVAISEDNHQNEVETSNIDLATMPCPVVSIPGSAN